MYLCGYAMVILLCFAYIDYKIDIKDCEKYNGEIIKKNGERVCWNFERNMKIEI